MTRSWTQTPFSPRGKLAGLAKNRLVNAVPEACGRVAQEAIGAIKDSNYRRARRLIPLRLEMLPAPSVKERQAIGRIFALIDQAEEIGVGPQP